MTAVDRPTWHRRPVRRPVAITLAVIGGLLLALSMPPIGFWILAPVGLAFIIAGTGGRPYAGRAAYLFVGLSVFNLITLSWLESLHPAALLLIPVLAAYDAAIIAIAPGSGPARNVGLVSAVVLAAALRWTVPWGGVPLSNLSLTQADGPLIGAARVGTALAVVALVALGATIVLGLAARRFFDTTVAAVVGAVVLIVAFYAPHGEQVGSVRVAAVQGGGELGTRARDSSSAEVFERHVAATRLVTEDVDLILWPEDVVTAEAPFADSAELAILTDLAVEMDATLVVGLIEREPGRFRNAAVVITPDGEVDRYEKINRVPFGEFIPFRGLVEAVVGEVESLVPRDAVVGEGSSYVDTPVGRFGTVISFELFFPRTIRPGVQDGAGVLLGPTNGSSYPDTRVPEQTIASSQLRAVESGRWMVQAAPTGYTGVIDAYGNIQQRTGLRDRAVIVEEVPVHAGETWAIRYGSTPIILLAVLGLALALWFGPRRDRVASWLAEPMGSEPSGMQRDPAET